MTPHERVTSAVQRAGPVQVLRANYRRCESWISTSTTARSSRSSVPTARASRRPSRSWRATASATPGQVSVLGEDPGTAGRSWRARIGIVLQESSDFGMLTVLETARMFAKCYGAGPGARGTARTGRAGLEFRFQGQEAVRRPATTTRRRSRHHRQARTALPGRADYGFRSRGPAPVLGSHQTVGRRRHHDRAHHSLPGGGRRAGGPRRGHRRRPGGRGGLTCTVDGPRGLRRDGAVDGGRAAARGADRPSHRADPATVGGRGRNWLNSPSHDLRSKTPTSN